ncbi:hypothetical protein EUGRSUZ_E03668 [Eucalyptus grandis]|uniref:Uncharacterized protein n=2 Tax=Eucalyptus grandis TaxID=71139 RepID=A0ACC3L098_EUCGR|nr:hypothetical protein EUGRSUZ_E03668 [Eucalyptus grandis]
MAAWLWGQQIASGEDWSWATNCLGRRPRGRVGRRNGRRSRGCFVDLRWGINGQVAASIFEGKSGRTAEAARKWIEGRTAAKEKWEVFNGVLG